MTHIDVSQLASASHQRSHDQDHSESNLPGVMGGVLNYVYGSGSDGGSTPLSNDQKKAEAELAFIEKISELKRYIDNYGSATSPEIKDIIAQIKLLEKSVGGSGTPIVDLANGLISAYEDPKPWKGGPAKPTPQQAFDHYRDSTSTGMDKVIGDWFANNISVIDSILSGMQGGVYGMIKQPDGSYKWGCTNYSDSSIAFLGEVVLVMASLVDLKNSQYGPTGLDGLFFGSLGGFLSGKMLGRVLYSYCLEQNGGDKTEALAQYRTLVQTLPGYTSGSVDEAPNWSTDVKDLKGYDPATDDPSTWDEYYALSQVQGIFGTFEGPVPGA